MYKASNHSYKSFRRLISAAPHFKGLTRRVGFPLNHIRASSIHGSAAGLCPRKASRNLESTEDGFDSASIQELIDRDNLGFDNLNTEDDFEPALFLQKDSMTGPPELAQSEDQLFGVAHSQFEQELPPISPLPSGLDPRQLPVRIDSLSDLGPNPSEEAYASALVHGRSIHLPYIHPRTHSIPAGNITFYSHHPRLLALFTHVASHAASSLAIPISKVIMLPTERSLWTVIRAPFAYKKSQENFERKTHKRMIKAWDADPEVIDRWVKYLEKHAMGGVGIRVTKWERLPIGIGKTRLARVKEAFKAPIPNGVSSADAKLLEVQQEGDSDANRKQAIQALGEKILKEELQTFKGSQKPPAASLGALGASGNPSVTERFHVSTDKPQVKGSPKISAKGNNKISSTFTPKTKASPSFNGNSSAKAETVTPAKAEQSTSASAPDKS